MWIGASGFVSFFNGPQVVYPLLNWARIVPMKSYTASVGENLLVSMKSGKHEVLPAPSEVFEDPVVQRSVSSFPALTTC
jgi:hypothetical protein